MAFLFKSKKQEREKARDRDASGQGSQGSIQGVRGNLTKDEKIALQRSTPTGSLNSLDTDGHSGSPDQAHPRRGPNSDQQPPQQQVLQQQPPQQQSDLPVGALRPARPHPMPGSADHVCARSSEMRPRRLIPPTRMRRFIPGLNAACSTPRPTQARSLDMAPLSTPSPRKRATCTSWAASSMARQ